MSTSSLSLWPKLAPLPIGGGGERERMFYLAQEGGATRLDGLNLGEVDGLAAEAGGELGNVEEDAAGGVDGAEVRAGQAADASVAGADRLLERAVLLGVVAVGAEAGVAGGGAVGGEALGELARGRGRVRLGAVVNGRCEGEEREVSEGMKEGHGWQRDVQGTERGPMNLIKGWRSA